MERFPTPDSALARLREGNARFQADRPQSWHSGRERRTELAAASCPVACIITCSDARVSPEILFDQALGDLFVVRLVGNVVTPEVVASVEFAVEVFQVPLVMVLGHSRCAAIQAALKETRPPMSTSANALLNRLSPALSAARSAGFAGEELWAAAIRENARLGAKVLVSGSVIIGEAVRSGRVRVLGALYDLYSGIVSEM